MRNLILFSLLALFMTLAGVALPGCSIIRDEGKAAFIDCGKGELANVKPIAAAMAKPLLAGDLTWKDVEHAAIGSGYRFGGCLVAHLHDLLPKPAGFVGVPTAAELALQQVREATGTNYSYRTDEGTL